jgi:uncharacterized membrane protein
MSKISTTGLLTEDGKSSTGLNENIAALLCYVLGPYTWIVGLIFFLIEKKSKYVRFHAMQALLMSAVFFVVWLIFLIIAGVLIGTGSFGGFAALTALEWIVWVGAVVICIIAIIKTYGKKDFVLPVIGPVAYKMATK